jgi:hypothetical protein
MNARYKSFPIRKFLVEFVSKLFFSKSLNLDKTFKYKAFISYSRAADNNLAPEIKSALQKFAKPWYKLRVVQVFCDQTNLTANPNLWGSIEKHLSDSEYFIYLASPQAAQSKWVKKEIQHFHSNGRADNIIIVLTDGNLVWNDEVSDFDGSHTNVLPKDVSFKQEPTWLDLTWIRKEQLSFRDPRFLDAIANLSATLRSIDKDVLIGKDVEEHRKSKRFRILSVFGLASLAIFLLAATFFAIKSERRSQERLVRTFVGNGIASLENNDYIMAFPWFVQAMINERNKDKKELKRFRVENLYSQIPELVQVWKTELPILKMDFVDNSNILIVSGHSANWWTNEFTCLTAGKGNCKAEIRLVNAESGRDVYHPIVINDGIRTMQINSNKALFASFSVQNKLQLWNLKDGKLIWEQEVNIPVDKTEGFNCEIAFNHQSSKLLFSFPVGNNKSRMDIYDLVSKNRSISLDEPNYYSSNIHFLGDSDSVIFLSNSLKLWDIKSNKVVFIKTPYLERVFSFQVNPDQKHLAISGDKSIENFQGFGASTQSLVAYASLDAIQTPIFIKEFDFTVNRLEFDAKGKILGTNGSTTTEAASFDDGTRVWDVLNGNPLTSWIKFSQEVDFSFDKEGRKIILSCRDGTTEMWEVGEEGSSGNSRMFWLLHDGDSDIKSVVSPDGRYILTSGQIVKLWKAPQHTAIQFNIDKQNFSDESSDTLSRWYVLPGENNDDTSASNPNEAYIYENKSQKKIGTLRHDSKVWLAQTSRDGNHIATVTETATQVWETANQRQLFKIPLPPSVAIQSIVFSSDNKKIVTCFTDFSFRVWDAATGTPISSYMKHPFNMGWTDKIWVRFSQDGKKLISTDNFSGAIMWDATTGDLLSAPIFLDVSEDSSTTSKQTNQNNTASHEIGLRSPDDWSRYAELISNRQMDEGGSFVPISNQEYLDKWKRWALDFKR